MSSSLNILNLYEFHIFYVTFLLSCYLLRLIFIGQIN